MSEDLISRQAAIDALNMLFKKQVTQFDYKGYEEADEKTQLVCDGISYSIGCVLNLPSAQPQHFNLDENLLTYAHDMGVTLEQAEKELTRVTHIAPQRIKGRWIKKESVGRWDDTLWECSECGCLHRDNVFCISGNFNFCPNCGAWMLAEPYEE